MGFDVFISYATKDKLAADAACAALEAAHVRCWIAPRDIMPGADWGASIIEALDQCRAVVLIFSASANDSAQIRNEVVHAVQRGLPVIPVRIEDIQPAKSLAYFMGSVHWLDALSPPLEMHLKRLADSVQVMLKLETPAPGAALPGLPRSAGVKTDPFIAVSNEIGRPARRSRVPLAMLAALCALLVVGGAAYFGRPYWQPMLVDGQKSPMAAPVTPQSDASKSAALAELLFGRLNTVIPAASPEFRKTQAQLYADAKEHKAQAVSLQPPGTWRATRVNVLAAEEAALENCQLFHGQPCVLVAVNDRILPAPPDGNWVRRDMPRVRYAGNFDPNQIPGVPNRQRADIAGYAAFSGPKAVAVHAVVVTVVTGAESQRVAEEKALDLCNRDPSRPSTEAPCFLYAVGNQVVLPQRLRKPLT